MSAAAVLRAARAAGVELAIDGNNLLLDAATVPPARRRRVATAQS